MKHTLIVALLCIASAGFSQFTPGNLVASIVGDGSGVSGNHKIGIRQYTKLGVQVGSDLSLNGLPGGRNVTCSFGETSEAALTLSADGKYLMIGGYDLNPLDPAWDALDSPRAIAAIDATGTVTLTAPFDPAEGDGVRGIYSPDGKTWVFCGGDGGLTFGDAAGITSQVLAPLVSSRMVQKRGSVYWFNGSNSFNGSNGFATWDGATSTPVFATPDGASSRDFHFVNDDTLYVTTSTGARGIYKMVRTGGSWTAAYNLGGTGVNAMVVDGDDIYVTSSNGASILKTTDTGIGFMSWSTVATLPTGLRFRGLEWAPSPATAKLLSGRATLGDYVGDVSAVTATVELRQPGTTTSVESKTVTLTADGSYSFETSVANGSYDVAVKASHWLRSVVGSVVVGASGASGVNVRLTNGDVDGDNAVTVFDYNALSEAFDSSTGDSHWNPAADLDGDGSVTVFDYNILSANFDLVGDE